MDLSIIIINWNSKDYLRECLKSVIAGAGGLETEILVIDNASHDGSAQMVAAEFPGVKFIQSDRNLGFSGGNNRAARQARGDLLLFLNPDTVVAGDALLKLVQSLRQLPDAGIVGARLLNSDRTLQTSCIQSFPTVANQVLDCELFRHWFPRSALWGMAALFNDSTEPAPVDAISGACLMIKRNLFEQLKGFDERYFMYSEDIDLCFRALRAGHKCWYVPEATVIHHGGGSSQKARSAVSNVMLRESVYRFMSLHWGRLRAGCFRLVIGLSALVRLPLAVAMRPFSRSSRSGGQSPVHKWYSILRWSLGMESWAAKE
jgi:GT2 family glycosyltransferase